MCHGCHSFAQRESDGATERYEFDHVIIASGHSWPVKPKIGDAELMSPWPFTKMAELPPAQIGILGSSLSAIDIVSVLGHTHGTFHDEGGTISWQANENASNLRIVMLSKEGIMPEGDFYYPFPYEPLKIITKNAVDCEVKKGSSGLLERVFDLLCHRLDRADPTYLHQLGPDARSIEGFSTAYFKRRQEIGGLRAVKRDFAQVRKSLRDRITIEHRHVLLRAHETFDRALRSLEDDDWELFRKKLLPIFTDCYAAVPHLSLARVIAVYDAGVLELKATGDDASFQNVTNGSVIVGLQRSMMKLDVMIDARGQAAAPLDHLPFPSLVRELRDPKAPLAAPFNLQFSCSPMASIYCLALPQILERHPFSEGLPNCAHNAEIVVSNMKGALATPASKKHAYGRRA